MSDQTAFCIMIMMAALTQFEQSLSRLVTTKLILGGGCKCRVKIWGSRNFCNHAPLMVRMSYEKIIGVGLVVMGLSRNTVLKLSRSITDASFRSAVKVRVQHPLQWPWKLFKSGDIASKFVKKRENTSLHDLLSVGC